ncbi:aminotransferase class I/II-fold pyridoxal phosphate-dependent enzyme [Paracoccus aminophilus]|uniref:8-amino-7-oxononanoate synthase n=1 Tax=Paracoccus aminophilus JCM 7686 TaxID=1367847 RepID=S5YS95_PARAH|nr:aminotransferase class I/II-fold pyridoxal phosphate-dependent enzyme [Paracoccus aminophilus]AGT08081.1 8-amino-7-oxononanoate synthase [Paracoccus aminophilus JCM 7686]
MTAFPELAAQLAALEHRARRRVLARAKGLDFASNDYLGLAGSALLREAATAALARAVPFGAGGSRLLRGNHPEHEALEAEAAAFFGAEAALFMGGGFQANLAILSTLPRAGDLILYDTHIHASSHDGMRLSRAETLPFAHNDATALRDAARNWRQAGQRGRIWIAVESLYSMDGDAAPLADFAEIAMESDAVLIVDEAHATGLFGPEGRGLSHGLPDVALIALHTCGKALGVAGALITAERVVIDALIARARPFIYATAPAPFEAALIRAVLAALAADPGLSAGARARRDHANRLAESCGLAPTGSQIIPIPVGEDRAALELARALQACGFDIRAIRPPTVPRGTARLRASITGHVSPDQISALFHTVAELRPQ